MRHHRTPHVGSTHRRQNRPFEDEQVNGWTPERRLARSEAIRRWGWGRDGDHPRPPSAAEGNARSPMNSSHAPERCALKKPRRFGKAEPSSWAAASPRSVRQLGHSTSRADMASPIGSVASRPEPAWQRAPVPPRGATRESPASSRVRSRGRLDRFRPPSPCSRLKTIIDAVASVKTMPAQIQPLRAGRETPGCEQVVVRQHRRCADRTPRIFGPVRLDCLGVIGQVTGDLRPAAQRAVRHVIRCLTLRFSARGVRTCRILCHKEQRWEHH
jgi:hypothetical protein